MKMKLILCFLAAAMVFNMLAPVSKDYAAVSSTFNILSASSGVKIGERFTVTVAGKDIQDMYACEVCLTFDDNILKFDTNDIASDVLGNPVKKVKDNRIIFAIAKTENQLPENGDVSLCS